MTMRMRKKPNLIPRMERCADTQIKEPELLWGKWGTTFPEYSCLYLELGCGKGKFTAETAGTMPDTLFVAVERVPDAMVVGMERVKAQNLNNVRFLDRDAANLPAIFQKGEVARIYINFCDPWPTKKHAKRRLTSEGFLNIYRGILKDGGEIHFKTDNLPLFEYSLEQFQTHDFALSEVTRNLHVNGPVGIMTDYEEKFYRQGIAINRCVATLLPKKEDTERRMDKDNE
jgi:tRNA (guanine-N7-)-methyltransferase